MSLPSTTTPTTTPTPTPSSVTTGPSRRHSHKLVQHQIARRGRRRLLRFGTIGWVILDFWTGIVALVVGQFASPYVGLFVDRPEFVSGPSGAVSFAIVLTVVAHILGLHDTRQRNDRVDIVIRVFTVVCLSLALYSMGWSLIAFKHTGRYVLLVAASVACGIGATARLLVYHFTNSFAENVYFLGNDKFSAQVAQLLDDHQPAYNVRAIVEKQHTPDDLGGWALEHQIDEIVFDERSDEVDDEQLLHCLDVGVKVSSFTDFVEEAYNCIPVEQIDARWLFAARLDLTHPYYSGIKRLMDIVVSLVGLVLSAPLMLLAAVAIKLTSRGGPILYSQERVGRFDRRFRIYKLRTMVTNAERDGVQWASTNDSRITPVGSFLRRTRLDEFPQFWNVLKGDMSLIGPRPERPEFVELLEQNIPFYVQRHLVKPGLTGWAQINYPYGASIEDARNKLMYDLFYIKNASIILDMQIFLRTFGALMKGSR